MPNEFKTLFEAGVRSEPMVDEAEPPGSGGHGPSGWASGCTGLAIQGDLALNQKVTHLEFRKATRFSVSAHSAAVGRSLFGATLQEWNDWRWQVAHRVRSAAQLSKLLDLTEDERQALEQGGPSLPLAITPYYASLLLGQGAEAIRKAVVPATAEFTLSRGEAVDPLGEEADSPVEGLVHRYPDRVLFLVTDFCSTNCRYCTRSRVVSQGHGEGSRDRWERCIQYISQHSEIRDVLISGGDPLTMSDERIEWLLMRLRAIPHVEFIRMGTKVPAVLPQRITPTLCRMLKKYHPLWLSLHFMHPAELTPETIQACNRLADAGIPLGSQTVLLKGVNDNVETMTTLVRGLLRCRVKPYYLYQCDPIAGSAHFRTPVSKGIEIIRGLRGHTTGYAVPSYVIDAPGGGGKIPVGPDYVLGHADGDLLLTNYKGGTYRYPDLVE